MVGIGCLVPSVGHKGKDTVVARGDIHEVVRLVLVPTSYRTLPLALQRLIGPVREQPLGLVVLALTIKERSEVVHACERTRVLFA